MVHRGKAFRYVSLKAIGLAPFCFGSAQEQDGPLEAGMSSLSFSASIGVINEQAVPNRLDDIHDRMMDNAIAKRRDINSPFFWIIDLERSIRLRLVGFPDQFVLNIDQVLLEILSEIKDLGRKSPALGRLPEGQVKVLEIINAAVKVVMSSHMKSLADGVRFRY